MTTCLTNTVKNTYNTNLKKAVELRGVSKKYPLLKTFGKDIRINFEDFWALKDVSFEAYQGQILGIIGRNGAGKTTLLNIIAGVLSPTQGNIIMNGRVLGLFNLGVGFQDELTGKENIFLNGALLGATRKEIESKLSSIIEFSELGDFINMPLGAYSQGMRLRLGFSILVNLEFDILIIDEVLAVGDALFQHKCFQRLMDLRRGRKTLIITTQNIDLAQRLCDKIALLDHGRLLFYGEPIEGINKYRTLLNTEKFFVGPAEKNLSLITDTKKWVEDISEWGKKLGTKEAVIESVEFINKFGIKCNSVKSKEPLKVKASFKVKNQIKDVHFGVAIFRSDGAYCYGPNTAFDGYSIAEINSGKGYFLLNFEQLLLAPGEYRISVAIWDKNETLAFDYHSGYYKLTVTGYKGDGYGLLNIPFKIAYRTYIKKLIFLLKNHSYYPDFRLLRDKWEQKIETEPIKIESVRLLNYCDEIKDVFITGEFVKFVVRFNNVPVRNNNCCLWLGIYRDDGIYCQGITVPFGEKREFAVLFSELLLLPGNYRVSVGVWDNYTKEFLIYHHAIYPFRMVFKKEDHGTVYLKHNWRWKLP
ncbi:MAG: ABC transporter ATP-binding protein [Candidatus Omnitrophica bacterium]|nr:ABC transporter ATP-binding protein [Candidatus Omnitrophota bacterium]